MPYAETHTLTIGPITLPVGVGVTVDVVPNTSGQQQQVTIASTVPTSRADAVAALTASFAALIVAASAEGVGAPVFTSPTPTPPASPTPPTPGP